MKNPLEAAEDYTKQAGWRDLAELKCCMCALGLLLGLAVPRRWRKKAGPGRSGALRSHMHPAGGEIPGAGRAAHTGDGGKTGTPRILLQKMRGRAGCGPAMMDARS